MSAPLLQVDAIQVLYQGALLALQEVSLTLQPGEIHALLGANGAGKSTTLKAVSNLLAAQRGQLRSGRILFDGQDIARSSPADLVRQGLAQVLEGRHCFASLSVEENLLTGWPGRFTRRAVLRDALERIYAIFPLLRNRRRSLAGLCSGGEQQMVAIGRALISRPRLLVLDEPSMGLAPLVVADIFAQLSRLNREEGVALLVAEQNSAVALQYAHRATVLENGASVLQGPAEVLRQRSDIQSFYFGESRIAA
ncbi:branched-chain amino acid ABC transporter ATP-binding protein [Herbaspirillum rubrisubalbicans]|jgi:branched-chain amino acid transport system ATP-binding protein|uniref:Branched-chain amino acid ABC transporter ATP-binding protein n=2 Tax=Herbaspirillum rubrisubalbicans TaxID=80842 RepID=A0ABX9BWD7_9BURK|nr:MULTISPECIES: ABC transporter ATP-binding protein [Herbaspirillum]MCP1576221.1 branched-chain amino acid transport system ATP-binding protein [Herbaspirillum rubrisubalbicans]NQE48964.1 branched-chain amino acid ABC transporter ATP-binding protein [Herbaspirillum rubrisubalbicans]QJP99470.1 ABC transporter ATP-binding protein [Herbaspirillum rubrisubalbicans Os34]RAM62188.1 branched-chain amino acid ABC transporter ATP-binding protein [Herbaspirillum rubrisubalbicans]RAN50021.1 branched-cha